MTRNKDGHGTAIEWTWVPGYQGESWNPIKAKIWDGAQASGMRVGWHCEHVTEGCRNCYAEGFNRRLGTGRPFKPGELGHGKVDVFLNQTIVKKPYAWAKPRAVFVCSMTDVFGPWVTNNWLAEIFGTMKANPRHIFICVTKRPERAKAFFEGFRWAQLANVWLLVSVHNQESADTVIPVLLSMLGVRVKGISYEPALGPVDFSPYLPGLSWMIAGGESGPEARPDNPDWYRSVAEQCRISRVPFFMKQISSGAARPLKSFDEFPVDLRIREFPV